MPELPEVETTRAGLLPRILGKRIRGVEIRDRRLRWPIPANLQSLVSGRVICDVIRRGKYLLIDVESRANGGFILWHLGMSGSIAVVDTATSVQKHDHLDIVLDDESVIRYHDPRRFGCVLWILGEMPTHSLLDSLGPEPLSDAFDAQYLFEVSRGRTASVKEFIMASSTVVGVGNIYASESLFTAKIRPTTAAGRVSRERYTSLVLAIKDTLAKAIAAGGSSLRNYVQADGNSGYFQLDALVYGRQSQPCRVCGTPIRSIRQGQRSTYYCPRCQT
ncbi:MAG: bifunctional DNA-formamidopyrimidine glycosylase/DNA-(apurinic or apyrimidinic site) lyase [Betaproteobacteria bacterium]|jgi:formamidopyrimidine-DNA glycosylase|nr:hypothetical protein AEM42_03860 [Betaproteobacteria bacterium UKL13-2]HCG52399.1 DNA-formamidopyrimidine glycosylase [Betaproteobacteria bacterium]